LISRQDKTDQPEKITTSFLWQHDRAENMLRQRRTPLFFYVRPAVPPSFARCLIPPSQAEQSSLQEVQSRQFSVRFFCYFLA